MVEAELQGIQVVAFTTIVFGISLRLAYYIRDDAAKPLTQTRAIAIEIAQCLAFIPRTSRSEVTITMGLLIDQSPEHAARISFLIALAAIARATKIKFWNLQHTKTLPK